MTRKPYSQAAENNKQAILEVLGTLIKPCDKLLEIGSGTGQHALFFANSLPKITWQPSDLIDNHPGIKAWRKDSLHNNILAPIELDVSNIKHWPKSQFDAIYTANTTHIMSWDTVLTMLSLLPHALRHEGVFIVYGPFNQNGTFTSTSNAAFDKQLKARAPHMGLRDVEALEKKALKHGLTLQSIHDMPANNKCLVFRK